jgi:hypothetical protein
MVLYFWYVNLSVSHASLGERFPRLLERRLVFLGVNLVGDDLTLFDVVHLGKKKKKIEKL